jgi:hypothetical protein
MSNSSENAEQYGVLSHKFSSSLGVAMRPVKLFWNPRLAKSSALYKFPSNPIRYKLHFLRVSDIEAMK